MVYCERKGSEKSAIEVVERVSSFQPLARAEATTLERECETVTHKTRQRLRKDPRESNLMNESSELRRLTFGLLERQ